MSNILEKDGLSLELLEKLSYKSMLGKKLKQNLHHFDEERLFEELQAVIEWYDKCELLHDLTIDYRIKSFQSIRLKYNRYKPDHLVSKVFNDLLGFRTFCDDYNSVLDLSKEKNIRIADMTRGKANNDGYRGLHVYFQLDNFHYPIEIQYNTFFVRQFNNWLHKYIYKKNYNNTIGQMLRTFYENGKIRTEQEFREVMKDVLSSRKEI